MTKFSISQAAFSGYRLLAAKPIAALAWFVFQLAVSLGLVWLTATMIGPQLTALKEMQTSGAPDPATAMALGGQTFPLTVLALVVALVSGAILTGAILRAVLRPGESAVGYLRFGPNELRLIVVVLMIILVLLIPIVIAWLPAIAVRFAIAGPQVAAMAMQGKGEIPLAATLGSLAAALPGLALIVFLYVKLSLASAQTVAERSIRIFTSWRLTKGVFWRTLATYLVAAIPLVILKIGLMAVIAATNPDLGFKMTVQPDLTSVPAAFAGGQLVMFALQALLQVISSAALLVPTVMIYRAVAGETVPTATVDDDYDDDDDED
jgi:hypothetical protein